jgi:branched-chain amino acid transport system substrate-binding protein
MRLAVVRWTAAAVVAGVLMAACGSSSTAKTSSGAAPSSAPSGPAGAPIVLGAIGSFTGAGSGSTAEGEPVVQAWVDYTNAHGGINGHPVKVDIEDDANDPATALADVKQLVQQDHVLAVLNISDDLASVYQSVLQQAGVPTIGQSESLQFGTAPDFYSTGTTVIAAVYDEIAAARSAGVTKLANLYCAEIASCAEGVPLIQDFGKGLGVNLVYTSKISSTAPSYTAPCLAAQSAGANGLDVTAASTTVVSVAQSCYSQGYKPIWVTTSGEVTNSWIQTKAFNGMVGDVQDVPWFDDSIPATKTMQSAIDKYEPGTTTNAAYGEVAILGWVAGMVFEGAAKAVDLGPTSTSADVVKGLDTIKDDTFGGLTPPLTFTAGQPTIVPCSFIVGIKGSHYTEPQGLKTACMPAS